MGHAAGKSTKRKPGTLRKRLTRAVLLIFAFMLVTGVAVGGWAFVRAKAMYSKTDLAKLAQEPPRATVVYDRNGDVITELTNSKIEFVPFEQIPKTVRDAIVAVEDSRFYEHYGVDPMGLARAMYRNLKAGSTVEGGSTITQQLAKTMLYSPERTLSRKINEAVASLKIEQTYSKDQILELYLNHIFYGEGAYGIQRAAETYFGKKANELSLAESATLAGLPKAPSRYSPLTNPKLAKERRDLVLTLMAQQGKITPQQRNAAIAEPIKLADKAGHPAGGKYPTYVNHVIHEAIGKYGITEEQILQSGLQIYTNLDPKVQEAAESVYRDPKFFPENREGLQSGIVLMEPKTGELRGLVGAIGAQSGFRNFNYATQLERQPGSAIKPIVVYAPALMAGIGPDDMVYDEETDFGGGYKPMNYKKQMHGWVTVQEALTQSYNIPAVALLKEVGIGGAMQLAKDAGLPLQQDDRTFGLALGGLTKGTSPLAMAQAYTMFAGQGNMAEAHAIVKITDAWGKTVVDVQPKLKQLLDPSTAHTLTLMMQRVVSEGTGTNAQLDRQVAGKTGTTQLPGTKEFADSNGGTIDGNKDAWFVGYTPELVGAVWLGYVPTNRDHFLTSTGSKYPARLFHEVMTRALVDTPVSSFSAPAGYQPLTGSGKHINGTPEALLALGLAPDGQPVAPAGGPGPVAALPAPADGSTAGGGDGNGNRNGQNGAGVAGDAQPPQARR